jgi:adenylate kinase
LEKILAQIKAGQHRHWILNTHAVFRWKHTLISGFDPHYLSRLDPHLFATVTASALTTQARLQRQPRWAALTAEDVLTWRAEEQFATEEMARIHRKPPYLLPARASVETGFRLFFEPRWKKAYLSYPMQHVDPTVERGLDTFRKRLEESLVLFDPGDVNDFVGDDEPTASDRERSDGSRQLAALHDETTAAVRRDRLQQHIADQIVVRDYKLIQQSDMVVVYYDAPVPSPGVISEMKFALENGKQVYGVWLPPNEPSVFFTRYCSLWFRHPDALFEHFRRHRVAVPPRPRDRPVALRAAR